MLEPLGQLLYDLLRPRCVQLADLDTLAELIDILQHEVLRDQLLRRAGPGGEALLPSLSRSLADLQERLIYRQVVWLFQVCILLTLRLSCDYCPDDLTDCSWCSLMSDCCETCCSPGDMKAPEDQGLCVHDTVVWCSLLYPSRMQAHCGHDC